MNTLPKIIGLAGPARCGKNTLATYITEMHETDSVVELAFAAPIRYMTEALLGMEPEELERCKDEPIEGMTPDISPRHIMQTLGTEWGRHTLGENFWVDIAEKKMHWYLDLWATNTVIFTDVRFDNEARMIRAAGGRIWHMYRPNSGINSDHLSERGVRTCWGDIRLTNNTTIPKLYDFAVLRQQAEDLLK